MTKQTAKKVILVTDIPITLLQAKLDKLFNLGFEVEIFPEIKSEITPECLCIFAFMRKPSATAMDFLKKYADKMEIKTHLPSKIYKFISSDPIFKKISSPGTIFSNTPEDDVLKHVQRNLDDLTAENGL
ncbi:MAG: hypothetical protein PHW24_03775 [Candidatus Moranbacteria bacterium]|nr:hypothetical protein [Candidatus Moranbacteria bacterium]